MGKSKREKKTPHIPFCWNAVDKSRIERLQVKMELGRQEIIRMAIRLLAERENVA